MNRNSLQGVLRLSDDNRTSRTRSAYQQFPPPSQEIQTENRAPSHRRDIRLARGVKISRAALFRYVRVTVLFLLDLLLLRAAYGLMEQFAQSQSGVLAQFFQSGLLDNAVLIQIVGFQLLFAIALGAYRSKDFSADFQSLARALFFSSLAIAFTANLTASIPQTLMLLGILFLATLAALLTSRAMVRTLVQVFRRHGYCRLSAFIISDSSNSQALLETIQNEDCYYIVGASPSSFLDLNSRGESIRRIMDLGVDELIIDWSSIHHRRYVLRALKLAGVKVRVFFMDQSNPFKESYSKQVKDFGFLALNPNVFVDLDFRIKRVLDFICSAILLVVLSPIYLALALAIRLDSPGKIFYRQTRVGLHGKPIRVWKFRSMVSNAEKLQKDLEKLNENSDGILFKMKDDPRITKVGKFIRRYSLDELPQLFNVLAGEMSLIGPRPLPLRDVQRFSKPYFFVRHDILPGITGLWQVSGRSDIDNFEEAVSLDLEYIENWSLSLDLEILFRTFGVILKKSGAY